MLSDDSLLVAREMICIKKYLDLNNISVYQQKVLKEIGTPSKIDIENMLPVLYAKQKDSFINFMKYFILINKSVDISYIDYYVKTYNYCNNDELPVVDIISLTNSKNPKKETFKLLKEYKHLLYLVENKKDLKRKAIIKGLPSYYAVSKLRAKHQFGEEN